MKWVLKTEIHCYGIRFISRIRESGVVKGGSELVILARAQRQGEVDLIALMHLWRRSSNTSNS